ncbi:MAG: ABC transporter permease [bacterium]|nr:ABC transporter permease [bacterium]
MKKLELFIAMRYFRSKKSSKFVSVISLISILGIAIGVMALIVVLSVMNGFQNTIREKIINTGFHVYVTSYGRSSLIYDYDDLARKIAKNKDVTVATPFFKGQVIIKSTMQRIMGIDFHGLEPDLYKKDASFYNTVRMQAGRFDLTGKDHILIGQELARFLDVKLNDYIDIISPQGGKVKFEGRLAPILKRYRVAGIFKTGYYEYDLKLAFTSLESMQDLFNKPSAAWGIGIKMKNIFNAPKLAKKINKAFKYNYQTFTWIDLNHNLFTALKNEKTMMSLIVFLIIIVASFNIASTLIMMVTDKKKEIAILKAFGADPGQISGIFLLAGMFMGGTGLFLGVLLGFVVSWNLDAIFRFIEGTVNIFLRLYYYLANLITYVPPPDRFEVLARDVYYLDRLPVQIFWSDIVGICIGAVIISILFSFWPSRQATRFKSMEIIRYE